MSSTCTARDFTAATALGTYRRAESAGDYIATNARAWIAVADPKAALVLDNLLVLCALAYKYRCLWDGGGTGFNNFCQAAASDVTDRFSAFVNMSPRGWTKQQFDDNLKELVDADEDWNIMQEFMNGEAGFGMADISRTDRKVALHATDRVYAYAKPLSSHPGVLDIKLRAMAHMQGATDEKEEDD
jgi:hypothetical protein